MNFPIVQKTPLISSRFWTVMITCNEYYGMYVLCLYTMEIKCLHVNTSYSVSDLFVRLNTPKSIIKN
jgi:hypothetical protein